MKDSFHNILKIYANSKKWIVLSYVLFLSAGCSTLSTERAPATFVAPHNSESKEGSELHSKAQAAWEGQAFSASSDYHFTLAQAYSNEGKVDRAIEEYRAALAYDSKSSILHSRLAAEYVKKGTTTFAIEECMRALEIDPDNTDVRLMLGGIYSVSNQSELALAEYNKILKEQPGNDEAAVFKTQVLVEKEQYDEALKFIRGFTAKTKDSAAAWYYAGKLEHAHDHMNEAIADFRRALDLRPGFSQATIALGMIFETHGENPKAVEVYEAQMEEHQDLQIAGRLATLYLKLNQLDLGLKTLSIMKVLDPEDLNTQMKIGLVYMQKEAWEQAKSAFFSILEKVPDSDRVHYYLAAILEEQGQFKDAITHLEKVGADSKLFEDANLHASALYRKLLDKDKTFSVLKSAIKKSPENSGFYIALASLYENENDIANASRSLEDGLKLFPDHERMRYFHGALLDKLGKQDEAIQEMETLLEKNPQDADAMNFIGYTWTSQGVRLKDAEEMLKRALKLKPDSPFILDSLGWNQFMLGHAKDAMVYLEKAVSLKADEQAILEHLVEVYARNQMPERAQATRNKIRKLMSVDSARSPASVEEK